MVKAKGLTHYRDEASKSQNSQARYPPILNIACEYSGFNFSLYLSSGINIFNKSAWARLIKAQYK